MSRRCEPSSEAPPFVIAPGEPGTGHFPQTFFACGKGNRPVFSHCRSFSLLVACPLGSSSFALIEGEK
jgi:hypothetical protein